MSSRATTTATTRLEAACRQCGWRTTASNGLGNAARHHDATGHIVDIAVDREVTYGDPATPMPGQTAMFSDDQGTSP
jgi:hypothetical protein